MSLNLNESIDNLSDINSLEMDQIEETILNIFKSYGNLNERNDENNNNSLYSNKYDSNDSYSNNNNNIKNKNPHKAELNNVYNGNKGKIFDTAKIEKRQDLNMNNNLNECETIEYTNENNFDIANLLSNNLKGLDLLLNSSSANYQGKSPLENMNPNGKFF